MHRVVRSERSSGHKVSGPLDDVATHGEHEEPDRGIVEELTPDLLGADRFERSLPNPPCERGGDLHEPDLGAHDDVPRSAIRSLSVDDRVDPITSDLRNVEFHEDARIEVVRRHER